MGLWQGLDFHIHLLPGVDDGIATFEEACDCIIGLQKLGFQGAVLTPHIYDGAFKNTSRNLSEEFKVFSDNIRRSDINFPMYLAAEYFSDNAFLELISDDDLLFLPVKGERWVLLEFPFLQPSPFITACLSALTAKGYRPVIAHVERYRFVLADPAHWLQQFSESGALLQGDIGSLTGQHGEAVQRFAATLLKRGVVTLWGTDLHKQNQIGKFINPGISLIKHRNRIILREEDILPLPAAS